MVVTIIGWYGTETMGDIAILDGIFSVLSSKNVNTIYIGSLYPFYTKRTLFANNSLFSRTCPNTTIECFDIKDDQEYKTYISKSDLLIFGGGPLMDIEDLYLMKRCFAYAHSHSINAYVMGCGIGPLFKPKYIDLVYDIFNYSQKIALRDISSKKEAESLYGSSFSEKLSVLGDPAIISIEHFKKNYTNINKSSYIAFNLREYPRTIYKNDSALSDNDFIEMIDYLAECFEDVLLVPMLTFSPGCDDRRYLSLLKMKCKKDNVKVLHKPQSLEELYTIYQNALGCIGMRHHAVVMQTILNGNNIVIDYTEPKNGKTQGFISMVDHDHFYDSRIIKLQSNNCSFHSAKHILDQIKQLRSFNYPLSNSYLDYLSWIL